MILMFLLECARRIRTSRSPPVLVSNPPRPVCIFVEGRHDIEFLKRISALLHRSRCELPDLAALEREERVLFLPTGGGDFRLWSTRLAGLGCAEFHLYDRELPLESTRRDEWASVVNRRPRCRGFVTGLRSLENYLHPEAIREARGLNITFTATDDVAALAARAAYVPSEPPVAWEALSRRARRRHRDRAKGWLNTDAVERMTVARLAEQDPAGDVVAWLTAIGDLLSNPAP